MINRDGHNKSLWQDYAGEYSPNNVEQMKSNHEVIIVGGGITGITTALELQEAGFSCTVLEANNLCFGTTGGTTAHINTLLDSPYHLIAENFGADKAVEVARLTKEAIETIKKNIARYQIDCGFKEAVAYLFSQDDKQTEQLQKIQNSAVDAGLVVNPVTEIPVPIPFKSAIRAEGQAQFNPVKYVRALAKAFEAAGGIIQEQCRVLGANEKENLIQVETTLGMFTSKYIFYATHIPTGVNLLHLRCIPYRSYAMAVTLEAGIEIKDLTYDLHDPYRYYRSQQEDGINYLVAGGFDHKTGHEENTEYCFTRLEAHIRSHFEVKEVKYKWSSQYFEPADGLPYIGRLPGHGEKVLVATGYSGNGMPYSHIAALLIKHMLLKQSHPGIDIFDPGRIKPVAGFKNFIGHNADVAGQLLSGLFSGEKTARLAAVATGEAKLIKLGGSKIALYKDENSRLHAVSPACTHLHCSVSWNNTERSWDCPCHGARFSFDGEVLTAPASRSLDKADLGDL